LAKFYSIVGAAVPGINLLEVGKVKVFDGGGERGDEAGVVFGDDGLGEGAFE